MLYHHDKSLEKLNKDVTGFMDWATSGGGKQIENAGARE